LVDVADSKQYLVDSGSDYSIIPHKSTAEPTGLCLVTADGTPLRCWGCLTCTIRTRTRQFTWSFLLAPVAFPILGADFLCNFKLMVDLSNRRLVTRSGQLTQLELGRHTSAAVVTGLLSADPPPAVASSTPSLPTGETCSTPSLPTVVASSTPSLQAANQHAGAAKELLQKYPAVVGASKRLPPVKHAVEHLIETTSGRPVASRYRRLDPERLAAAKAEFAAMESQGIIRRSKSSWSSPLHMVEKTDGSW